MQHCRICIDRCADNARRSIDSASSTGSRENSDEASDRFSIVAQRCRRSKHYRSERVCLRAWSVSGWLCWRGWWRGRPTSLRGERRISRQDLSLTTLIGSAGQRAVAGQKEAPKPWGAWGRKEYQWADHHSPPTPRLRRHGTADQAGRAFGGAGILIRVPTDRSALDNATLLPAYRKPPLTPVLYLDAINISGFHHHTREVNPQAADEATPGGCSLAIAGSKSLSRRKRRVVRPPIPTHYWPEWAIEALLLPDLLRDW
jgi:hypothetical protein